MNDKFKRMLESIEKSHKVINILPVEDSSLNNILEKYDTNENSTFGTVIYYTGGIVVDKWIRIFGAGQLDFALKNQIFPYDNIVEAEDI